MVWLAGWTLREVAIGGAGMGKKLRVESEELRVGKKVEREIGDSCTSGESVASHGGDAVRTEKGRMALERGRASGV